MKKKKLTVIIVAVVCILMSVIVTFCVRVSSSNAKYRRYLQEGKECYGREDYLSARTHFIEAAKNALSDEKKLEVFSHLYHIDLVMGADYKEKIQCLEELVKLDNTEIQYYKDLIVLYRNHDMDSQVNVLLSMAPSAIKKELEGYTGTIPRASEEEGIHNGPITLELSADEDVTIYYTKDGSDVTQSEAKIEYATPIILKKEGTYTIRAYSVDSYGVSSKEAVYNYTISFVHVDEPEVSLQSGSYTQSKKIEVSAGEDCTVYYTTDGSVPTKSSEEYRQPLDLQQGNTLYSFVAVNKDGVPSQVVRRVYDFSKTYLCNYDTALMNLRKYCNIDEYNQSRDGSFVTFTYQETGEIDGENYYIINYAKENGSDSRKYAVSCDDGECSTVTGSHGNYQLQQEK